MASPGSNDPGSNALCGDHGFARTGWRERHDRQPVLIAIDEAHNVLPASTDDPLLQATSELGVLIAGEGRKFGLQLFIATQRPAKVHPNVVTQCDNLVLMRMNGARDVDELVESFSHVPEAMVRSALGFKLGQALLAGPISPVPTFAQVGRRLSPEGGGDVPTTWAIVLTRIRGVRTSAPPRRPRPATTHRACGRSNSRTS